MTEPDWRDRTARQLATAAARRVLLVEDDDLYVERARRSLLAAAMNSFSLDVAPTLAEALRSLGSKRYDVVILDLGLPDEQGVRTFERLHNAAPTTPMIILSSADDPQMAAYTLYLGAADYLVKNASDDLLLHVIGRAISRFRPNAGAFDVELPPATESSTPLSQADPAAFAALVREYGDIVDVAAGSAYRQPRGAHRTALKTFVTQLGRSRAASRDALEIHKRTVERRLEVAATDSEGWMVEARMVALELHAMLADFYRSEPPTPDRSA